MRIIAQQAVPMHASLALAIAAKRPRPPTSAFPAALCRTRVIRALAQLCMWAQAQIGARGRRGGKRSAAHAAAHAVSRRRGAGAAPGPAPRPGSHSAA